MKIQTNRGELDVMAWHIGRHVSFTDPDHVAYCRFDGQPVADVYHGLKKQTLTCVAIEGRQYLNFQFDTRDQDGVTITINEYPPLELDSTARLELMAVFEVAYFQSQKGLDEIHEEEERRRYGLPPKRDEL
jgi:hypothetical protein